MASSSEAPDYDPKTDPARKAKSNDPGWKYAYWQDPARRDWVTCIMCGNEALGCLKRFKQHLAGGYGDIVLCTKATTEIRKEMEAYLQKKRRRPLFLDGIEEEDGEDEVVEVAAADKIEDIGKDNVVQVVTDNGANYKAAGCFIEVLGRMIPNVETQMKINRQAIEYEEQRGDAFSNKMAKESYDKMSPPSFKGLYATWEKSFGKERKKYGLKNWQQTSFTSTQDRFHLEREHGQ
ncbi:unnamed protein product [Miscanthus lutarioriparius]|uniref:Uncharacterized protein n=1 Tax=Miscanthus lutarioriparius TaxID=422564 RepID=A0A811R7J1_9POAL|nr:unnamed protein product [Miscanthus lutarioriparius]